MDIRGQPAAALPEGEAVVSPGGAVAQEVPPWPLPPFPGSGLDKLWKEHFGLIARHDEEHPGLPRRLYNWHIANLEFANAGGCRWQRA